MKRFIVVCFTLLALSVAGFCGDGDDVYSASLSTNVVLGNLFAGDGTPFFSANAKITSMFCTVSSTNTSQTVTFYEGSVALSTASASAKWSFDIPADNENVKGQNWYISKSFGNGSGSFWDTTKLLARKSSTASTVKLTLWYR